MDKRDNQIYIGRLPYKITQQSLEKEFSKFGEFNNVVFRQKYAFIVYLSSPSRIQKV